VWPGGLPDGEGRSVPNDVVECSCVAEAQSVVLYSVARATAPGVPASRALRRTRRSRQDRISLPVPGSLRPATRQGRRPSATRTTARRYPRTPSRCEHENARPSPEQLDLLGAKG
jgi:hypothetical protein